MRVRHRDTSIDSLECKSSSVHQSDATPQLFDTSDIAKEYRISAPSLGSGTWSEEKIPILKHVANMRDYIRTLLNKLSSIQDTLDQYEGTEDELTTTGEGNRTVYDVFISHASEDKSSFVAQLAQRLHDSGVSVWYDQFTLKLGDSLLQTINHGLANSRYGIVVLSPNFFAKDWPLRELAGLMARERNGVKIILPIWHNISAAEVVERYPLLADRLAVKTSAGMDTVVSQILDVLSSEETSSSTVTTIPTDRTRDLSKLPIFTLHFRWVKEIDAVRTTYRLMNVAPNPAMNVYVDVQTSEHPFPNEWPHIYKSPTYAALIQNKEEAAVVPDNGQPPFPIKPDWSVVFFDLRYQDAIGQWWWHYKSIRLITQAGLPENTERPIILPPAKAIEPAEWI